MRTASTALTLALISILTLGGCFGEPTVPYGNPPQQMTAAQITAMQTADLEKAKADAAAKQAAIAQKAQEDADKIADAQRQREIDFQSKVAHLDADSRLQIADWTAQFKADSAAVDSALKRLDAGTKAAQLAADAESTRIAAAINASGTAALASIQAKLDQRTFVATAFDTGSRVASNFGPVGEGIAGVLGLGALLFGTHKLGGSQATARLQPKIQEAADKGYDDGHAAATASANLRDAHYDMGKDAGALASTGLALAAALGLKIPPAVTGVVNTVAADLQAAA